MGRYISKHEREAIIVTDALLGTLVDQVLPYADKMGKQTASRLRRATTDLRKGLEMYTSELSEDDKINLVRTNAKTRIVLSSESYKLKKDEHDELREITWTLAEFSINDNCTGCTKQGETCSLKHALARAAVPYATTEPDNCPYELPPVKR